MVLEKSDPARRLSILYVVALSSIAVLTTISHTIVRANIQGQTNDSKIVNVSGRQRMLSQRLAKDLLLFQQATDVNQRQLVLERFASNHQTWRTAHTMLKENQFRFTGRIGNTPATQDLFDTVQPYFDAIDSVCLALLQGGPTILAPQLATLVSQFLKSESFFLDYMDRITYQYEIEASERVRRLKQIEWILFVTTWCILVIEGLFVLLPAVKKIRLYFNQLVETNLVLAETGRQLTNNRRLLLSSTLDAQERERKRISLELHDGLGPLIALARMNLETLRRKHPRDEHEVAIARSLQYLDDLHAGIKQIAQDLLPPTLEHFGLEAALKNLVEENAVLKSATIQLYVQLHGANITKTTELHLFRIVQELLVNAIRHANANEITIQVFTEEDRIVVLVEDDGCGLDSADPLTSKGLGLKNLLSRVNALTGTMHIETSPERGTTIAIYLPILNRQ